MHEIITLRHDDTSIAFDTTAATWSLTDLWRAAGSPENREPWNWARKEGKRYLETLATTLHVTWSPENLSHSQVFAPEDHDGPEEHTAHSHVERDSHVTWSPENVAVGHLLAPEDHDGPEEHTAHSHVERDSHVTWSPENLCDTQVFAPADHDGPEEHTAHSHVERDSHVTWSPENPSVARVECDRPHSQVELWRVASW